MEPLQVVNSENGGPFAIQTRFGWIISGNGNTKSPNVNSIRVPSELDEVNNINNEGNVTKGKLATKEKGKKIACQSDVCFPRYDEIRGAGNYKRIFIHCRIR